MSRSFRSLTAGALGALVVTAVISAQGTAAPSAPVWHATGPEGGSAQLAVARGVVYAGTSDGVYASTTWGASWQRRSKGLPEGSWAVGVDPRRPQLLYAASRGQIWKSVDGARTWRLMATGVPATELLVAPSDPRTVYTAFCAWGCGDLWRSRDGGRSWVRMTGKLAGPEVAIDPFDATKLYAATYTGTLVSADGGRTWRRTITGPVHAVAADPATRNVVYARTGTGRILRSTDGGASWRAIGRLDADGVTNLAVDPTDPEVLWATSSRGVHRSSNGGRTWRLRGPWLRKDVIRAFAIDPSGSGELLAGDWETVFRSVDGGATWQPAVRGLVATNVAAIDARFGNAVYAVTAGRAWRSRDRGATWRPVGDLPVWAQALAVDPSRATTLYAGGDEIAKSLDGGRTWKKVSGFDAAALAVDPTRPATVYAASDRGVAKSTNGARTWTRASRGLTLPEDEGDGQWEAFLVIDPSRPRTLYAAVNTAIPDTGLRGQVFKTTDGADHWRRLAGPNLPDSPVSGLTLDPRDPDTVYLATAVGLRRSDDGGETWWQAAPFGDATYGVSGGVAVDPARPGTVYAASGGDVFVSTDRIGGWRRVSAGLRGRVSALAVDATGSRLYALTSGHGVFVAQLPLADAGK